jgi:hypothetical protein
MTDHTATHDIEPLSRRDLERAADGHPDVAVDELARAVSVTLAEMNEWGDEWADREVPEDWDQSGEPTVIAQTDDYVCIYVSHVAWGPTIDEIEEIADVTGAVAAAVPWALNEFARRHGASPDTLGAMDTAIIPRTGFVDELLEERR